MPQFGDTSQGASSFPCSGGRVIVGKFALSEAGDVTGITVFYQSGQAAGTDFRGLIYADSGGAPGALVAVGASVAVPGTVGGELESAVSPAVSLSPGDYWIGAVVDSFEARWSCDAGAGGLRKEGVSFASPAGTFGTPDDTTGDRISAYATYTVAGGGGDTDLDSDSDAGLIADLESDALAADLESDALAADLESDAILADLESDSDAAAGGGTGASAAAVWGFVLSNGKTAGENLVEIHDAALALLAKEATAEHVAGGFTVGDILRILAAVAVGKTTITSPGAGSAFVTFRSIDDALDAVEATMSGSERVSVTLDPTETS